MKILALLLSAFAAVTLADVKEHATGISFKDTLKLPGASTAGSLAGTGVRVKKIGPAAFKVYAVGMYVDSAKARSELSKHSSTESRALSKSDAFFKDARSASFEKTLVLKMARKVGAEKMVNALAESVKPRLAPGGDAALEEFQTVLLDAVTKEGAANKGMQFGFVCKPGSLCVSIDGKTAGTINSEQLRSAMLDVYLGKDAVSPGAKTSFAEGMSSMFKQ
ncbi:chalcone isomerase [Tribonema minus]|uniref:Chalcone isomerase n=1 Tax=Tribonema minus TaxID=303371 RepID=A0A835Z9G1_9STRA|nr:chalcone isomerase [Tribonema minus]